MRDLHRRLDALERLAQPPSKQWHSPAIQAFLDKHQRRVPEDSRRTRIAMEMVFQQVTSDLVSANQANPLLIASFALLRAEEERLNKDLEAGALTPTCDAEIVEVLKQRYYARSGALGAIGIDEWYYAKVLNAPLSEV